MITKYSNWNKTTTLSNGVGKLSAGGYICKIKDVVIEQKNDNEYMIIIFDINEGDYKEYYANKHKKFGGNYAGKYFIRLPDEDASDDDIKLRQLKTFIEHIESSNQGYVWNFQEQTLKGKLFGGIFGEKEYSYEGKNGVYVTLRLTASVSDIKEANYIIPPIQKLRIQDKLTPVNINDEDGLPF